MVDASTHIRRGHPITFVLLAIISFIVAVIASVITAKYNDNSPPSKTIRDRVRLLVFDGWWAFVFSIAYVSHSDALSAPFVADLALSPLACSPQPTLYASSSCSSSPASAA